MKITKALIPFIMIFFISIIILSCKKDCPEVINNNTVPGLWIGTYTVDQLPSQAPLYYSFIFKPDSKLLTESKGGDGVTYYTQGTWVLNGSDITCTYTSINFPNANITQSAKLTFAPANDSLSAGTWKDLSGGTNTGKFQAMKKIK
jgi:hypothetical protein